ncbi:hypothetical protein QE152_g7275 [Popillia japonica]|uniref:Uncharacterized protein n=1 Tax=Popillia japonica TaxID=7064 RepID=A0AAW1MF63_POPJA
MLLSITVVEGCAKCGRQNSFTLVDGINLIPRSWQMVSVQTIRKCYIHAGFYPEASVEEFDSENELLLTDWLIKQTSNEEQVSPNVPITEDCR